MPAPLHTCAGPPSHEDTLLRRPVIAAPPQPAGLPDGMWRLACLEHLLLSHNALCQLPDGAFEQLGQLQVGHVGGSG